MTEPTADFRHLPFRSAPAWDISDEEISEWSKTPGRMLAAHTAKCIRDGKYDDGREIYPPGSEIYRETTRGIIDQVMGLLAERGMARKTNGRWHAITPGRMASNTLRAVSVLLASRNDLPPALAAELDAWKTNLDALTPPGGALASKAASQPAITLARPLWTIAAG